MRRFEDKTAVVTGGGTGIGRAAAERLAAEGAHVFIMGRRRAGLDETAAAIGADSVTVVAGDISRLADLDRLYDAVRERGRGLDVVFANAAVSAMATLEDNTEEFFDMVFGINVRGTLFTVQKALPLLNEGAAVILTSSTAAEQGREEFGTYGASKAAVRAFARAWSNELRDRGIRVNTVSPGPIDTPALVEAFGDEAPAMRTALGERLAPGRIGRSEEVAAAVAFLASEESSFIVGGNLLVDGGENQGIHLS